jgi:succinate dehydrogenase / fumarate reductase cytochrome b subunit
MDKGMEENREGIKGWLNPSRYGINRFAYWLQRLTGLGLLAYFIAHISETSNIVYGKEAWDKMLSLTQTTAGHIILIIVIGMCVFHAANGVRLYAAEHGKGIGRAGRPEYPYRPTSLSTAMKASIWVSIALAVIAMLYGAYVLFLSEA